MNLIKKLSVATLFSFLFIFSFASSEALGATYYVSPTGLDSNPGSATSPFKTFAKGTSILNAGDTLLVNAGTYNERVTISRSGNATSPINVRAQTGQNVIIDLNGASTNCVDITGSYVNFEGFEVMDCIGRGVAITGSHNKVNQLKVHDTDDHGIYTTNSSHNTISNNTVYMTALSNEARTWSSGWSSGIKVRVGGSYILVEGNTVYHNYGEGIAATRGSNITIRNNHVYDNYSINIYVDNSYDVVVEKNFITCTSNSGFERDGHVASGIALNEEFYSGWGVQLARVMVKNNIVYACYRGLVSYAPDVPNGGLDNVTIANNTFWLNKASSISIAYPPTEPGETNKQRNTIIANNIIKPFGSPIYIEEPPTGFTLGLTLFNNFWDPVLPSTSSFGRGTGDLAGDVKMLTTPGYSPASFRLSALSPAINAGSTTLSMPDDFEGKPRVDRVDMGAIEYSNGTTVRRGDTDNDLDVDIYDYNRLVKDFGLTTGSPADFDTNGVVNVADHTIILAEFGR